MWGSMERDIRRIPGVVSCLVTETDVVVLVEPVTDASAVHEAVEGILASADDGRCVKVAGGYVPPAQRALAARAFRPAAFVAAITATAALGVGSLVGGWLGSIDRERAPTALAPTTPPVAPPQVEKPPVTPPERPDASPRRTIRIVTASGDVTPRRPVVREVVRPVVRDVVRPTPRAPEVGPPPIVSGTFHGKAPWRSCQTHRILELLAEGKGERRGNGPPIWSRSIRLRELDDCWWGRDR